MGVGVEQLLGVVMRQRVADALAITTFNESVVVQAQRNINADVRNSAGVRYGGVRVNVLAPGAFDTPFDEKLFPPAARPDVPLGRMGSPEEAAGIIAFLLSDEASYVSGSVWRVDGGRTALSPASSAGVAAPDEHTEF